MASELEVSERAFAGLFRALFKNIFSENPMIFCAGSLDLLVDFPEGFSRSTFIEDLPLENTPAGKVSS